MSAAQKHGAELRAGQVTGIVWSADRSTVRGVDVGHALVEADAVVIAMGPWSLMAAAWLDLPAVFGQRSPSLVYDTGTDCPADALFLTAFSKEAPLPLEPVAVTPDPSEIDRLQAICVRLSPVFRSERITARQACFRPVTQDGLPLIGKVPQSDGAYVATGHSVWGILNAPATGEALAELIAEGVSPTLDLTPFDPDRLRPLHPPLLRSD